MQANNYLPSNGDLSKKMNFHPRNNRTNNLTLQDCDEILQIQGMQQNIISDQLQLYPGNLKITIKDKPAPQINQDDIQLMRKVFNALLAYTVEQKRLRLISKEIQEKQRLKCLKWAFNQWKSAVDNNKLLTMKKRDEYKLEDLKKIEMFIQSVNNQQKQLEYKHKKINNNKNDNNLQQKFGNMNLSENNNFIKSPVLLKNCLNSKQKIIAQQRMKLAEQNRLIEEMKLKQIQAESKLSEIETLNVVNETITNCKERSRRLLMQLVKPRKENETNNISKNSVRTVNTPQFLIRMEARAALRREQVQRRNDERRIKIEQQQEIEKTIKINDEKRRKKAEQEARENAKRIIEERERKKIKRLESIKVKNEMADNFYRKYLLTKYGIRPLIRLLEMKRKERDEKMAKKVFLLWKSKTNEKINEKKNFYKKIYEKKLLEKYFKIWREKTINIINERQLINKYNSYRLEKKYFNKWSTITLSMRIINNEKYQKAVVFYNTKIINKYFKIWKKYVAISDNIKDSDERKNLFRKLVKMVVPDFSPEVRGVSMDD